MILNNVMDTNQLTAKSLNAQALGRSCNANAVVEIPLLPASDIY